MIAGTPIIIAASLFGLVLFTGGVPKLPKSVPPSNTHRRRIRRLFRAAALVLIALVAVYLFGPVSWKGKLMLSGSFFVMCASFLLMGPYYSALRMDYGMTAVTTKPWLHWLYSHPEWEQWQESPTDEVPETYFGNYGLVCGDEVMPWDSPAKTHYNRTIVIREGR